MERSVNAKGAEYLIQVSQDLSTAHTLDDVTRITRKAAREICQADGATFVLREGGLCSYVDEDAISPLWKGRKFPLEACISGWSILRGETVVIEDIYEDPRVPHEAYRPTFVKSLAMVPIRENDPIGALGNYWAEKHRAPEPCLVLLRSLANLVAIAVENVRLIRRLEQANEELRESLRARDEFLSIASHELRTPLSSLSLQLQVLDRKFKTAAVDQRLKGGVDLSLRQVRNLHGLIENLLDVSKIRLQRLDLKTAPVDLSVIVREAVDQCAPHLRECKGVELDLADSVHGEWDEVRVKQIVTNLLTNACKYAPEEPIEIKTRAESGVALLSVQDRGPGIPPDQQQRIFTRFARASNDNRVGGLGLGLFITKRLVEAHQGRIYLESEPGRGAKFTVELPCSLASEQSIQNFSEDRIQQ